MVIRSLEWAVEIQDGTVRFCGAIDLDVALTGGLRGLCVGSSACSPSTRTADFLPDQVPAEI